MDDDTTLDRAVEANNPLVKVVEANQKLEVATSTALLKRVKALATSSEPVDIDEAKALETLVLAYRGATYRGAPYYRGLV